MSFGVRIRGGSSQLQISDSEPVYMVIEKGRFTPSNWLYNRGMDWRGRHYVAFSQAITTAEPPLIFIRFDESTSTMLEFCTPVGVPGAWTGFAMLLGWKSEAEQYVWASGRSGDWFVASCKVAKSAQQVGLRIYNKDDGSLIYDSGYPLVKFLQQTASFQSEGRENHYWLRYSIGKPDGAYVLGNTMTGALRYDRVAHTNATFFANIQVGYRVDYPGKLMLWTYSRFDIAYQAYRWSALFASPGS